MRKTEVTGRTCPADVNLSPLDVGYDVRRLSQKVALPDNFSSVSFEQGGKAYRVEGTRSEMVKCLEDAGYWIADSKGTSLLNPDEQEVLEVVKSAEYLRFLAEEERTKAEKKFRAMIAGYETPRYEIPAFRSFAERIASMLAPFLPDHKIKVVKGLDLDVRIVISPKRGDDRILVVSPPNSGRIEVGITSPSIQSLFRFGNLCEMTLEDLVTKVKIHLSLPPSKWFYA